MTHRKKPFTTSNYYTEQLSEDDFSSEDNSEEYSAYDSDSTDKHPNWSQCISSINDSTNFESLIDLLESPDSINFPTNKSTKLWLPLEFDCDGLELLQNFLDPRGNILAREETGLTAKQQRKISRAIRRTRANGLTVPTF